MLRSISPTVAGTALVLVVLSSACGDDSIAGTGGGGGSSGTTTTSTTTTATTTSTTTSTTTTGTTTATTTGTTTTTTTSTGTPEACEDATGTEVDVVIRNDSSERIFLAIFPDYGAADFGWFAIDGSAIECPCLKPSFCSSGASNESGPSVGFLDPGGEMTTSWSGVIAQQASATCGHSEGCALDVVPPDGPLTFRVTGYRTADCASVEGCECDLEVEEPCYSSIEAEATLGEEIEATVTVDAPVSGPVTIAFVD